MIYLRRSVRAARTTHPSRPARSGPQQRSYRRNSSTSEERRSSLAARYVDIDLQVLWIVLNVFILEQKFIRTGDHFYRIRKRYVVPRRDVRVVDRRLCFWIRCGIRHPLSAPALITSE